MYYLILKELKKMFYTLLHIDLTIKMFSVSRIKQNTGRIIPFPVEDTVEYLKSSGGMYKIFNLLNTCNLIL